MSRSSASDGTSRIAKSRPRSLCLLGVPLQRARAEARLEGPARVQCERVGPGPVAVRDDDQILFAGFAYERVELARIEQRAIAGHQDGELVAEGGGSLHPCQRGG